MHSTFKAIVVNRIRVMSKVYKMFKQKREGEKRHSVILCIEYGSPYELIN